MSSANVLPSAPPAAEPTYALLYPNLPIKQVNAYNFWLTEISKIEKQVANEVEHYRLVLKKYKKAREVVSYSMTGLGVATAVLSSRAFSASLTGIWVMVGVPVGVVGALCGVISTALTGANKKLEVKEIKHSRAPKRWMTTKFRTRSSNLSRGR